MDRKKVKRLLALLKAEVELEREFEELKDLPEGFKESFESQENFRGWINYHVTWDVDEKDVWKVILLRESLVKTWNRKLAKSVPILTSANEVVTQKQFDEMEEKGVKKLSELEEEEPKKKTKAKPKGKKKGKK